MRIVTNFTIHEVNIIRIKRQRSVKWGGNLTRMEHKKMSYRNLVGRPIKKSPLSYLGVDERKMLRFPHHAMFCRNFQHL
jgi:hypothetical protein